MNKKQKEVLQSQLNDEENIIRELKQVYKKANDDVVEKIKALEARTDVENMQSIVYQKQYQQALKTQLDAILDVMNGNQFDKISDYLSNCYESGFVGAVYDLHGQKIPLIMPIDQEQVVKAIQTDSKISEGLYKKLGVNTKELKDSIRANVSRGIAASTPWSDVARNIDNRMKIGMNKSFRIARTEGHRISNQAAFDAQNKAKSNGADIVKQWDASMDRRTRPHHAQLDGQIRELDEPFDVAGRQAQYPGDFGIASEDINCRCAVLQRASWALDEDELKTLQERAEYFGLDKTDSFEEFKTKYIKAIETDPNEGKVFHMTPEGDLVEGEMPGATKYYQNGLTGEVSVIEEGKNYGDSIWTLNEDGTFFEGKAKYQAQYKLDLKNEKVLTVDISKADPDWLNDFTGENKAFAITSSLPKELQKEIDDLYLTFGGASAYEDAMYSVLKKHGYNGLYVVSKGDKVDDFIKILDDSVITKTKKSKLETLTASLKTQQKKLSKIDNKTYSGIWKDDVKVYDYVAKQGSIQAKRDYYLQQIANGNLSETQIKQFQKYLDDLDEFEELGKKYEAQRLKIAKIQSDIKKVSPKSTSTVSGEAFTQARKDNALWFDDAHGGFYEADKYFDPKAKSIHSLATSQEHDGFYTYTAGSGGHNRPLAGFQKPYSAGWSDTGWEEKYYVGAKNVWIDYEGKGDQIRGLTSLIEKSTYDKDVWLQSGQGFQTIEGFLNIPYGTLSSMSDSELQQFVGRENVIYNFVSAAVNEGGGSMFNEKPLKINFYAPEGSQMLYASDVGAFGKGENEIILQRGGSYQITKMYWGIDKTDGNRRKIFVDMEIHPEKGYDLFQQDPTEWKGSKKNYRS